MEGVYAFSVGVLFACGLFLCLRARTFPVVLGLTLLSYAVNLFLFSSGRLVRGSAPILDGATGHADPLPQALVLTAIVIGFAMTAFVVVLAMRSRADCGSDHVDGRPYVHHLDHEEDSDDDHAGAGEERLYVPGTGEGQ